MNKFQSLFLGATMAATTATAVAFAPSSASAITLNGDFSISSGVTFTNSSAVTSPATINVRWANNAATTVTDATGSFSSLSGINGTNGLTIKDLFLTRDSGQNNGTLPATYSYAAIDNFLTFTNVILDGSGPGTLTFDLDPGQVLRTGQPGNTFRIDSLEEGLTGVFEFLGNTPGSGTFTASGRLRTLSSGGAGTLTLTAQVPEPITMGGLAIGAGFGAYLKKRYSKKEKQAQNA